MGSPEKTTNHGRTRRGGSVISPIYFQGYSPQTSGAERCREELETTTGDPIMEQRQRALTLGELIRVVSECSHTDRATGLAVADLLQQGVVVRARPSAIQALLQTVGRTHKN